MCCLILTGFRKPVRTERHNLIAEDAPFDTLSFDTLRDSGNTLLRERRFFEHLPPEPLPECEAVEGSCLSSPAKTLKSTMMRLGVSKAEGGYKGQLDNRHDDDDVRIEMVCGQILKQS